MLVVVVMAGSSSSGGRVVAVAVLKQKIGLVATLNIALSSN